MPQIITAGADYSASPLLANSPTPSGCRGIWDFSGGNADSARKSFTRDFDVSDIGSPTWRRPGVILDADNSLGTGISGGMEEMTLLGVFFRRATTAYMGNHDNSGPGDALVETTSGVTRFRSSEGFLLPTTYTLDLDNPCPQGAPFFFAASFDTGGVTATVGYQSRFYAKRGTFSGGRGLSTTNIRIGTGNPALFTDGPFMACGAGIWNRALNEAEFRAVYDWFRHRHRRHGLHY